MTVLYGNSLTLGLWSRNPNNQEWVQGDNHMVNKPEVDDEFGYSLAFGNFDGWLSDDLAIGVPGEGSGAGATAVIYGTDKKLDPTEPPGNQLFQRKDLFGPAQAGDRFGEALG